ncbi:hypothetical protein SEA_NANOSMITE_51 [Mycobacterium phage Nanosmite]|nr:hypothetical protein SEA_NANOSMITE_51 [Mycobacterium phage Nanosmite]
MSLETYVHNPTEVRAIQVARPFKRVADAVPYARSIQHPHTRRFLHIAITRPGELDTKKAYEGDWIVQYPTGCTSVLTDEQFQRYYGQRPSPAEFFDWLRENKNVVLFNFEEGEDISDTHRDELLGEFYGDRDTA